MPGTNGQRAEVHAAFRFAVQIDGITGAVFTECTLPTLEVEVHQQMEGGLNNAVHQLPGRVKAGKITLKRGIATSSDLFKWYVEVAKQPSSSSQRTISVVMFDSVSQEVLRWSFQGAFPSRWTGPAFGSDKSQAAIETLELAYQSMDVE
jgi:phage tail-like protein